MAPPGIPLRLLLLTDLISLLITLTPGLAGWLVAAALIRASWNDPLLFYVLAATAPLVACLAMIAACATLRLLLPRLRPGVFRAGAAMAPWYCHLALNRAPRVFGFQSLIFSFRSLRFLYFRALGARISYSADLSISADLLDLPMITIGPAAVLGDSVTITGHTFVGDRLLVKAVDIGARSFLGRGTIVGPASTVGEGAWVGAGNFLAGDRLPADSKLRDHEWGHGNPEKSRARPESS